MLDLATILEMIRYHRTKRTSKSSCQENVTIDNRRNIWHPKAPPRDDGSRNVNQDPNDGIKYRDEVISHATKDNIDTISRKLTDKLQLNNEERSKKKGQSNQGHRKDGNKRPTSSQRRKKPTESDVNPPQQEQTPGIKSSDHPINNDDGDDDDPENPKNKVYNLYHPVSG